MAKAKQGFKRKRSKTALPVWGAAGVSLAMAGGASATASTANLPSQAPQPLHEITLSEEEISDVSLATFYVFYKENESQLGQPLRLAAGKGGGGGGGGCGHGGGGGGCGHGGGGGGCGHGGGGGGCGGGGGGGGGVAAVAAAAARLMVAAVGAAAARLMVAAAARLMVAAASRLVAARVVASVIMAVEAAVVAVEAALASACG